MLPITKQGEGHCTKSDEEVMMPQRIAGWQKTIWLMLLNLYRPISLGIAFDKCRPTLTF